MNAKLCKEMLFNYVVK